MTNSFIFLLFVLKLCLQEMRLFKSEQVIDLDPYIVILHIPTWVSDSFEISVEYTPYWYLKDPPLPRPEDFDLVDVLAELVVPYPSPLASLVETNRVSPDDSIVDPTSDTRTVHRYRCQSPCPT